MMEDEELPSESTARPSFRRNLVKNITLTNSSQTVASSKKARCKKTTSISSTTEKSRLVSVKRPISSKENSSLHSTFKAKIKKSKIIVNECDDADDSTHEDYDSSTVQNSAPTISSPLQSNHEVEKNRVDLDHSFNSNVTDTSELNQEPNTMLKTTNKTKDDVLQYFNRQPTGQYRCNLCVNTTKLFSKKNDSSDANFRSHLGRVHGMIQFLYPSQQRRRPLKMEEQISNQRKKVLDEAAIQAIVQDSYSFNLFRNTGMKHFLSLAVPSYRGPHRQTVVKRLKAVYNNHRSTTHHNLSNVSNISLSADVWKNHRRDHFICLSAHHYDERFQSQSSIIAFRRFLGNHYSERIENFIMNEIEKLGVERKICALTTDNGSDIRSAAQNVVQNGLWLFNIPKTKRTTFPSAINTMPSVKSSSTSNTKKSNRSSSTISNSTEPSSTTSSKSNIIKSYQTASVAQSTSNSIESSSKPSSKSNNNKSNQAVPVAQPALISIESSSKPSPKSNNNKSNEAAPVAAAVSNSTECTPSLLESNIDELNPSVELISNSTKRIVATRIRPD